MRAQSPAGASINDRLGVGAGASLAKAVEARMSDHTSFAHPPRDLLMAGHFNSCVRASR
jgi:hypothetical protein